MAVVWLILKIILWIILGLILLILGLLTVILCAPIRYRVIGEKYETMKLNVSVTWLCHIISVRYNLEQEGKTTVKIFGKVIGGEKKEKKKKKHKKKKTQKLKKTKTDKQKSSKKIKSKTNKSKQETLPAEVSEEQSQPNVVLKEDLKKEDINIKEGSIVKDDKIVTEETVIDIKKSNADAMEQKKQSHKSERPKQTEDKSKEKTDAKQKKQSKKSKKDKANESGWLEKLKGIRTFWKDENNKTVIKFLKKRILLMLKQILPRKFRAKVIIGTGDPATTGYIVGAASMLYTVTGNKLQVVPDFSEQIIQGDVYAKGRIYLIILVWHALRIILNKRARQLYKTIKS